MPTDKIPNMERVSADELALLQAYRVCAVHHKEDLYQLAITLALRCVAADSQFSNVVILAKSFKHRR
jgi:hypothetical protein